MYGGGAGSAPAASLAGSAKQVAVSGGAGSPTFIDFPDVHYFYPAACNNAGPTTYLLWSLPSSGALMAFCRGGTNNINGTLEGVPSSGGTAYFQFQLPSDWDSSSQPFIKLYYGSGTSTAGTVIWTVSSACSKSDGTVTDNPAFLAESPMPSQSMTTAAREWATSAQFVNMTAGNNCVPGSIVNLRVALSGSATADIVLAYAVITTPRLIAVQAN